MRPVLALISHHEGGYVNKVYLDTEGLRTWGIGWCIDRRPIEKDEANFILQRVKGELSPDNLKNIPTLATFLNWVGENKNEAGKELAFKVLENEAEAIERGLAKALPWWENLSVTRQAALIDMGYNMGLAGVLNFKRTLSYIENEKWQEASLGILATPYAKQTGTRAISIAGMIANGKWPSHLKITD